MGTQITEYKMLIKTTIKNVYLQIYRYICVTRLHTKQIPVTIAIITGTKVRRPILLSWHLNLRFKFSLTLDHTMHGVVFCFCKVNLSYKKHYTK